MVSWMSKKTFELYQVGQKLGDLVLDGYNPNDARLPTISDTVDCWKNYAVVYHDFEARLECQEVLLSRHCVAFIDPCECQNEKDCPDKLHKWEQKVRLVIGAFKAL